jgi:hypothetical protein
MATNEPVGKQVSNNEDLEAWERDRAAWQHETYSRCAGQGHCADEFSAGWRFQLTDAQRGAKCQGCCPCAEHAGQEYSIECDFSLERVRQADGSWGPGAPLIITSKES